MGLVIVKQPTATVEMPVDIPQLGQLDYEVTWNLLAVDELEALDKSSRELSEVIIENCKGIEGPKGLDADTANTTTAPEFNEDVLREFLNVGYYKRALAQSFFATQQGRAVYAAKN